MMEGECRDPFRRLLLWLGRDRSHRLSGGNGLLPLPILQSVVGRTGQCVQSLETERCPGYCRLPTDRTAGANIERFAAVI
jgi:hypothetical protein